ncbi:glycine oxidase ThiO [Williamsia serinedens]|uniref:glycine oxidase n=1 Tax=Williamsia serinedens TaxID=391736 RepID=A0ABT1H4G9_9NOCA|nr:glycine oxidase ThiO [Williamsia serinedens]MCP2162134.1 glycine oxidase [Williamsia serinedens]
MGLAPSSPTLAVVGGGVVGSAIAWRAARAGWRTTLVDDGRAASGSQVAAGMLGVVGEARFGDDEAFALTAEASHRWAEAVEDLDAPDVVVARDTVLVGADRSDLAELTAVVDWSASHGAVVETVAGSDVRSRVPGLAGVRRGVLVPGEGAVDNRAVLAALSNACAEVGVRVCRHTVTELSALDADQVVVANGAWLPALVPSTPIRIEKGEVLRLRRPPTAPPPPTVVVRARWHGRPVYVVPRPDGVVVGATQYEVSDRHDTAPRAGGVGDLLRDVTDLMPGLVEYRLDEVGAGFRPLTPDGLPLVGRVDERTVVAAGHGRGGILLAPLTADIAVGILDDRPDERWSQTLDPGRFA